MRQGIDVIAAIARREIHALASSMWGWALLAAKLLLDGLLFHAFALTGTARFGAEVLADFFYILFGTTILLGVLLTMRLFPEDESKKTSILLAAAPIPSSQIILGKYASAMATLLVATLLTGYLPALVFVHGKISWGQIGAGYLGVTLVGMATCAIGTLMSSMARTQLQAALLTSGAMTFLLLGWLISSISSPPLDAFFAQVSFFDAHFKGFMRGRIHASALVYYLGLTGAALWIATTRQKLARRA